MADNRELALVLKLVADQFQSELKKSGGALGQFSTVHRRLEDPGHVGRHDH